MRARANPGRREMLSGLLSLGGAATIKPGALWAADGRSVQRWNGFRSAPRWQRLDIVGGDTLLVSAKVAGVPVQAILDTGSGATIVSKPLAATLGRPDREARTLSGLSAKTRVDLVRDVDVAFSGETRRLPFVVVADLGAMTAAFGSPVDMLLGADMLSDACLAFDIGERRFATAPSGSFRPAADWAELTLRRGTRQELLVLASIHGLAPAPMMLDSGSSAALMLSSSYMGANELLTTQPTSTAALGTVEGVQIVRTLTVDKVALGAFLVGSVPALALDRWASESAVGNIGMPLLGQFDLVLDLSAARLWLRAADAGSRLPLLKDRSGLGLAPSPASLTVVHVAANSPASGGWTSGDEIVAINGVRIDESYKSGWLWRWRYGAPGTRVLFALKSGEQRQLVLEDYY